VYIERATLADERVMPLADVEDATAPYFSMILVRTPEAVDA
jgi:precorrin-2/cobalt-factor-2 C20-methyltransferase